MLQVTSSSIVPAMMGHLPSIPPLSPLANHPPTISLGSPPSSSHLPSPPHCRHHCCNICLITYILNSDLLKAILILRPKRKDMMVLFFMFISSYNKCLKKSLFVSPFVFMRSSFGWTGSRLEVYLFSYVWLADNGTMSNVCAHIRQSTWIWKSVHVRVYYVQAHIHVCMCTHHTFSSNTLKSFGAFIHDSPYQSILVYRSAISMIHTDVPTYGMMECTNRLVCTTHTVLLLDRYILPIPSGTLLYDEPCFDSSHPKSMIEHLKDFSLPKILVICMNA